MNENEVIYLFGPKKNCNKLWGRVHKWAMKGNGHWYLLMVCLAWSVKSKQLNLTSQGSKTLSYFKNKNKNLKKKEACLF